MSHWGTKSVAPSLQWRHNQRDGISNHQPHDCVLNRLFRHRSKKRSKLRVTALCEGNSPVTGEFPAQRASDAENVSIWWRNHVIRLCVPPFPGMSGDYPCHLVDMMAFLSLSDLGYTDEVAEEVGDWQSVYSEGWLNAKWRNSSALTLELRLFCISPSM